MEPNIAQHQPDVLATPPMPQPKKRHIGIWIFSGIAAVVIIVCAWWLISRPAGLPGAELPGGGATLSASASIIEATVGQQFTVDFILDGGELALSATDLVINYDSTLLRAVDIKAGEFMPVELAGGETGGGRASITVASGTTPATGSGTVLTLTFEAIAVGRAVVGPVGGTQVAAVGQSVNVIGSMVPVTVTIR